jgi:HisJ family histidinol phosphate phosphatase
MSEQNMTDDPRIAAVPDIHGHAKGEHKLYIDERPIPYTARMLFLWFFHACRRGAPRFLMVADHINYLTFEDPAAVNLVRRALKLAQAGDLYGAAETAGVEVNHAAVVGEGLRRGMRYSIGAEVDNDPRSRPDAQNIVDAMRPDGIVRSVHFLTIKHPQFGENWPWPFDNPEFRELYEVVGTEETWELYMATLLEAVEKLPGNIVGHFYVPAKFGHWPSDEVLESYEDRLIDACAERGMAVEINSRYFYKHAVGDDALLEKHREANLRLLRKAKAKGVMVAVGSDAHSPKDQGRGFDQVLALLDRAEINEIAFPIDGRLARVALRATEELRQSSSRAVREERVEAGRIPGNEEPPAEIAQAENGTSPAAPLAAKTQSDAAVAAPAPRKRPSRAKKPRAAESSSNGVAVVADPAAPEASAPEAVTTALHAEVSETTREVMPPSVEAQMSNVEPETPSVETEAPSVEAEAPSVETETPSVEAEAPSVEAEAPSVEAEEPSVEAEAPSVEPEAPSVEPDELAAAAMPFVTEHEVEEPEAASPGADAAADELAATQAAGAAEARESETVVPEEAHAFPAFAGSRERPRATAASRPAAASKRSPKTASKSAKRSKAAGSKTLAKKSGGKKAVAKKAPRRIAAAAPAKKTVAKKAVPARKAAPKAAASKTASRSSVKKAAVKKTAAKKKATKSRR